MRKPWARAVRHVHGRKRSRRNPRSPGSRMTTDPKTAAREARARAEKAAEYVRDLRRLLGQAMGDEAEAKRIAREAERVAG